MEEQQKNNQTADFKTTLKNLWANKAFKITAVSLAAVLVAIIVIIVIVSSLPQKSDYYIGDTVSNSKSTFCVNYALDKKTSALGTVSNGYYITVSVTYENKTDGAVKLKESDFKLYNGSKKYSVCSESALESNALTLYEDLGPGLSKTFTVTFETPSATSEADYILVFSGSSGTFKVNLKDGESSPVEPDKGYH